MREEVGVGVADINVELFINDPVVMWHCTALDGRIRVRRERESERERLDVGFAMGKIEWEQCAMISWEELG